MTKKQKQEQLEELKRSKSACEKKLSYFESKIEELSSVGEFKSVLTRIQLIYSECNQIISNLEQVDESFIFNCEVFEDRYGKLESFVLNEISKLESKQNDVESKSIPKSSGIFLKIPEIPLPKFNGEEEQWLEFRDLFTDLIHNNGQLSDIAKFHYLITCVRDGKAYKYIQPIPVSHENYKEAFDNLFNYYNNEIKIQKIHVKRMYDIKRPSENSAFSLQSFLDTATKSYNSLKALKVPIEHWNLLLLHHLCEKLDDQSKAEIISKTSSNDVLTFEKFSDILNTRIRILEAKRTASNSTSFSNRHSTHNHPKPSQSLFEQNIICPFCKGPHQLNSCNKFTDYKVKPQQRFNFVKRHNLCVAIAIVQANSQSVQDKTKVTLKNLVSTSVDKDDNGTAVTEPTENNPNVDTSTEVTYNCKMSREHNSSQVLLAIILLWTRNSEGDRVPCRALLDSGSQANFISHKMSKLLGVKTEPTRVQIAGINDDISVINKKMTIAVESQSSDYNSNVECLLKSKIAGLIPLNPIKLDCSSVLKNVQLADPYFATPESVDLLLGAELFLQIIKPEQIEINNGIILQNTVFGFIIMGRIPSPPSILTNTIQIQSYPVTFHELNEQIQKFWQIESVNSPNNFSIEEKMCERNYVEYIVALPVKDNISDLGDSSSNALQQFFSLEKRLEKNNYIRSQYNQFMKDYLDLDQMEEVMNPEVSEHPLKIQYFLPHHSVTRESSTTTKLRVVFNASSKTSTGLSLNDCLMTGPTIQQDLCSILLRFRKHQIGITGDITKMYRQILVKREHRDLQRIWWRDSPNQKPKCYRLKTVTYGTASAPFLAIRSLFKLASDEETNFPLASHSLKTDFYVDDVLTGANNYEEASTLITNLVKLLSRGCFELQKIFSNHPLINSSEFIEQNKSILILGMNWDIQSDMFYFSLKKYPLNTVCTKRSVLSEIAQLFDPLGFCGPIILTAKLFMQRLWSNKLDWDDELPQDLSNYWIEYKKQLTSIDDICVPRCVIMPSPIEIELHGFGDASERGYGCCIYIRSVDRSNNCVLKFLCSKNRIAPLKTQSIPRLELCASLLLAELMHKIILIMDISFTSVYFWTDSEITLYRIRSVPSRFCPFVANRISRIQDISSIENWNYVPSSENPSDCNSRGLMPIEFNKMNQWFQGPEFLLHFKELWPAQPSAINIAPEQMEFRKTQVCTSVKIDEWEIISNCSNYIKLLRKFCYVLRFTTNLKHSVKLKLSKGNRNHEIPHLSSLLIKIIKITPSEMDFALKQIVKHIQNSYFSTEISLLRNNKQLPRSNKLVPLNPFIDSEGLLRVGGRLKHSNLSDDYKHQMLLPASHSFCKILVRHEHQRILHAGAQALLYSIREKFWIIGGRNLCKTIVRHCVHCIRSRPATFSQIMGQLPKERVTPSSPFDHTGIDFCGPFQVTSKVRSRVVEKMYVAIFICFATKAIHMEIVFNLSTAAFLAAFRRFVSRRGLCSNVYSDNATNFVGSRSELQELRRLFSSEIHQNEVLKCCSDNNITWHTIPPRSPHFGGLWEAVVKSAKSHFHRVVGNRSYTHEQLQTLMVEIEGCLNSRPLGPMSDDPNDLSCLTPGHFLIGRPIMALPDPSLMHLKFDKLSSYQKVQSMFQDFWHRWSKEYLGNLQYRRKWSKVEVEPKINDLVILKENNFPPLMWPLGRIVEIHRGKDGFIRVASVKSGNKIVKRAIAQLCPLQLDVDLNSNAQEQNRFDFE